MLPLKPLFFKYFNASDLWGTIAGKPKFELIHTQNGATETVRAILRIPVQKQGKYITLERNYVAAHTNDLRYDQANNRGYFLTVPFALSIFPFVRTPFDNKYSVQLVDRALGMLQNYALSLSFFKNGYQQQLTGDSVVVRERSLKSEKRV